MTDQVGSVVSTTEAAGAEVSKRDYLAFGGEAGTESRTETVALYTGKEWDAEVGAYYFNARWYDPELGRFISEDRAKDQANWFIYVGNNPMTHVDPMGLGPNLLQRLLYRAAEAIYRKQFADKEKYLNTNPLFVLSQGAQKVYSLGMLHDYEAAKEMYEKGGGSDPTKYLDWEAIKSKGESRFEHVWEHASDQPTRQEHGVFSSDPVSAVARAWERKDDYEPILNDGALIYNIEAPYPGVGSGKDDKGKVLSYVTIVVTDKNKLVTAFPSEGNYGKDKQAKPQS